MTTHDASDGPVSWQGVGLTDQGRVRTSNQDAFTILNDCGVWIVADGMGGRAGGDVASRMTVDGVAREIRRHAAASDIQSQSDRLRQIIRLSNQAVREGACRRPELIGMGTTLVVLMIIPSPQPMALIAHVGDSRAYCLRQGTLTQWTRDHSFVEESIRDGLLTPEEAVDHPMRHVLTRAVGADIEVEAEITIHALATEDVLLLCTDGLTKMLPDHCIRDILLQPVSRPIQSCQGLVDHANARGGEDNITVILVRKDLTT